jgi:hydroxysqualene dehydroxylase
LKPLRTWPWSAPAGPASPRRCGRKAGHEVELFEMAAHCGGRARTVRVDGLPLDNGQHILIGAYQATLALMHDRRRRCDDAAAPHAAGASVPRRPRPDAARRPPVPAFVRAVLAPAGLGWGDRLALLASATRWAAMRFRCDPMG